MVFSDVSTSTATKLSQLSMMYRLNHPVNDTKIGSWINNVQRVLPWCLDKKKHLGGSARFFAGRRSALWYVNNWIEKNTTFDSGSFF